MSFIDFFDRTIDQTIKGLDHLKLREDIELLGFELENNMTSEPLDSALIKKRNINSKNYYYLSKKKNLNEAAKNLYSILRKIKKDGYKMIAVEKIPNIGIGKTINDRLNRASNY